MRDTPQKLMFGAPSGSLCIISPLFFEESTVNGKSYLAMLQNFFIPQLQMLHLISNTIFQQDRAPCYYALHVWQFLDDTFSDCWINRGGLPV